MTWDLLYWREPAWLWAMMLPLLVVGIAHLRRHRQWADLVDPSLSPWAEVSPRHGRGRATRVLSVLVWLLLCVALAGPRTARWIPPAARPGVAVVAILDQSLSMAARDERPDRRARAQALLAEWTSRMPEALRLGLVVYAGHAHRLLTPTADHQLARHFVNELDGIQLPTLGNSLGDALRLAAEMLRETSGEPIERHLLLLSDGDLDALAQKAAEAAATQTLRPAGVRLHVIGIGGTEAVAVPRNATEPLVIDGQRVMSRREGRWLAHLGELADGDYVAVEDLGGRTFADVLGVSAPRIAPEDRQQVLWDEWFGVPLGAGALLLLFVLEGRRSTKVVGAALTTAALALFSGGCDRAPSAARFGDSVQAALSTGDYTEVRRLAAAREGHDADFAEGVACYRLADYPCALQAFARAAWLAPDDTARGRAAFNLANTHFRLGEYAEASVLFAEAGMLGVSAEDAALNRAFADSLVAAVERRLDDIAETRRRADWRAAAHGLPEELQDRLAEGITLSDSLKRPPAFATLSPEGLQAMVARGVVQASGRTAVPGSGSRWVETRESKEPLGTAGLFNRLLPMEAGILSIAGEPYRIEGQRPW